MDDDLLLKEIAKVVDDEDKMAKIRDLIDNICDYCHDAWRPCYCAPGYDE